MQMNFELSEMIPIQTFRDDTDPDIQVNSTSTSLYVTRRARRRPSRRPSK